MFVAKGTERIFFPFSVTVTELGRGRPLLRGQGSQQFLGVEWLCVVVFFKRNVTRLRLLSKIWRYVPERDGHSWLELLTSSQKEGGLSE